MLADSFSESLTVQGSEVSFLAKNSKINLARHERIKCDLRLAGTTLAEVAKKLGISQGSLTNISQGHRTSHRAQEALAAALGMTAEKLFPDRYEPKEIESKTSENRKI
ncbi:helix-turn-helix domain-containing protein [Thioclava sp. GXIMD4216]|uniref:helix-turn-helix domain-containing protein n=1 Tax=Thioclava sp. GXIMD4216 TaxID=3131929 RepID=UPI0030D3577C